MGQPTRSGTSDGTVDRSSRYRAYTFRSPAQGHFLAEDQKPNIPQIKQASTEWLVLKTVDQRRTIHFGSRIILRTDTTDRLEILLKQQGGTIHRRPDRRTVILQFADASSAAAAAHALSSIEGVEVAVPTRRHIARLHAPWAPLPNDPFFDRQYYLDNTGHAVGVPDSGVDLNLRGAWPLSTGSSVHMAIVDDGLDVTHPDLTANLNPNWHHNFFTRTPDPQHMGASQYHGTAVAGLAAAHGDNHLGIVGAAPNAQISSWVIFNRSQELPDSSDLADAFQHGLEAVSVQNHSWGNADFDFLEVILVEQMALDRALIEGRQGRGTIFVRSAGNARFRNYKSQLGVGDVNLDGFANWHGAITVGSVRRDGKVASYSTPGECILISAPGGEVSEESCLFTLDPVGDAGRSTRANAGEALRNYLPQHLSLPGTSFSTPLISGIIALMLDVRPDLTWQDVQVLLALSGRHFDPQDPDLKRNGAGLWYSRNTGFGVPDAGLAVRLALAYQDPPAPNTRQRSTIQQILTPNQPLPARNLYVRVYADELTEEGLKLIARGGAGMFPDETTASLPLMNLGGQTDPEIGALEGKAAFLLREGEDQIVSQIEAATDAGAAFAIFRRDIDSDYREFLLRTDLTRIPSVSISGNDGRFLADLMASDASTQVQLGLDALNYVFEIETGFIVESVQLRARIQHPQKSDLRITLLSPQGTRSVLHRPDVHHVSQLDEWVYGSKRHLLESGHGKWTVSVSDVGSHGMGYVHELELILHGQVIEDTDGNGLDDVWENTYWGTLGQALDVDSNGNDWTHAVEQFLGLDPLAELSPSQISWARADSKRYRLSWPTRPYRHDVILHSTTPEGPFLPLDESVVPGREGVLFFRNEVNTGFFRIGTDQTEPLGRIPSGVLTPTNQNRSEDRQ